MTQPEELKPCPVEQCDRDAAREWLCAAHPINIEALAKIFARYRIEALSRTQRQEAVEPVAYWKAGTLIIERCLIKAVAANPNEAPMPLTGAEASLWHRAQMEAYRHALEMMGWTTELPVASPPQEAVEPVAMTLADVKGIASSALQSACESDPADPEHPDTICITTGDFETIVRCALENWKEPHP